MSTASAAVTSDPYAAYGGRAATPVDPYAAYGGSVQGSATPQEQPGFFENLGHTFGIGTQEAEAQRRQMTEHPVSTLAQAALGPAWTAGKGIYQGAKRIGGEVVQAGEALAQGNPAAAAVHAVSAVPLVGPAMVKMADEAPAMSPDQSYLSRVASAATPGNIGTALGTAAQVAPMVAGAADAMLPAGRPMVPNIPVTSALGRVVLLGNTPEGAYESAMKPSTTLSPAERTEIIQTGLQNEIPVSKAGVEKLSNLIEDVEAKKSAFIQQNPGRTVDPNAVATRADQAKANFQRQVSPQQDVASIEALKQQYLEKHGAKAATQPTYDLQGPMATPGTPATLAAPYSAIEAQAEKQATYGILRKKYGEQGSAAVEAQKALARGLKEEIATQFPEISNLNATETRLLDLQPVLERAVNRISNHQNIGIGTPVVGIGVKAATGSSAAGTVGMVLKAVFDNPAIKSRLAIAVSKGAKIPYAQAMSRVQTYSSTLGASLASTQANSGGGNPNQPIAPQE